MDLIPRLRLERFYRYLYTSSMAQIPYYRQVPVLCSASAQMMCGRGTRPGEECHSILEHSAVQRLTTRALHRKGLGPSSG